MCGPYCNYQQLAPMCSVFSSALLSQVLRKTIQQVMKIHVLKLENNQSHWSAKADAKRNGRDLHKNICRNLFWVINSTFFVF